MYAGDKYKANDFCENIKSIIHLQFSKTFHLLFIMHKHISQSINQCMQNISVHVNNIILSKYQ